MRSDSRCWIRLADVQFDIGQHQVGALSGAQDPQRGGDVVRLDHLGSALHRDAAGGADLAGKSACNEQTHDLYLRDGVINRSIAPAATAAGHC